MEKQYISLSELDELTARNEVYLVSIYDRLAKQSSSLVYLNTPTLIERLFRNSLNGLDPLELEFYLAGVFDTEALVYRPIDKFVDIMQLKNKIKQELANETR